MTAARRQRARYVVGFDSEDDGAGHPFLWCFTHAQGRHQAQSREAALEVLLALERAARARGEQLEVWATNLEYDLCNLFDRTRVAQVSWHFGRSHLCSARWRGIDFRDTVRHLPASVEELGTLVGMRKLKGDLFKGARPDPVRQLALYRARCARDASITYRAARMLGKAYAALKVRTRTTLASTALALWRERFWRREVNRVRNELWNAAHESYHGGRTQAFAAGNFDDVTSIDVASMFPWAMTSAPLPLPWGMTRKAGRGERIEGNGIYRVRIRSQLAHPRLPVRSEAGTIYPNGEWVGWYVGEELQGFVVAGGEARVLDGYVFLESCRPFDAYVKRLFALKQRSRGLRRTMFKLLLNALYGKYGQQGSRTRAVPLAAFLKMERPPLSAREWNGLVIFRSETMPPPWSNQVWPAFVTARARLHLAREIERLTLRGCRVLYCDTDSLMFQGRGPRYRRQAKRIGDWELEGVKQRMAIVGKKEYALEVKPGTWEAHVKGVPFGQRQTYLETGRATFERPTRLKESAAGVGEVNHWRTVTKERRIDLRERAGPDGTLPHPVIRPERRTTRATRE